MFVQSVVSESRMSELTGSGQFVCWGRSKKRSAQIDDRDRALSPRKKSAEEVKEEDVIEDA